MDTDTWEEKRLEEITEHGTNYNQDYFDLTYFISKRLLKRL